MLSCAHRLFGHQERVDVDHEPGPRALNQLQDLAVETDQLGLKEARGGGLRTAQIAGVDLEKTGNHAPNDFLTNGWK